MIKEILGKPVSRQFLKFCLVGVESTVAYYLVFLLLFHFAKVSYLIASPAGFIFGAIVGYKLNKSFSFESQRRDSVAFPIYLGVYSFSLVFTIFAMKFLVENVGIHPSISVLIVISITTFINFFGVKIMAFQNKRW